MGGNRLGRREFLKSTAAGLGGFVYLGSPRKSPLDLLAEKKEAQEKTAHRVLGRTGLKVPAVTMGVMNTGNPALVKAALDAGMFFLDTAQTYQRGTNEAMIGEVVKGRPRDSFVIATKARLPNDQKTGLYTEEATEEAFRRKIDASLKALDLDTVDIYYHHNVWVRASALYEPILNALVKAKKDGKIRWIGITSHRNEPEVIEAAVDSKVYDVVLPAYNFRQKHSAEVKEAIARAAGAGLGVVAMKTIGGNVRGAYASEQINARAGLKWALQDRNVHTIIAGFTTFDQMNLDLQVMRETALSAPEKEYLRTASLQSGLYCQGCGQCLDQCAKGLPLPDLMRAHMYLHGYRNLAAAQELLDSLRLPPNPCGDCLSCEVKCSNQWRVSARVRDVVRLRDVPPEFIA